MENQKAKSILAQIEAETEKQRELVQEAFGWSAPEVDQTEVIRGSVNGSVFIRVKRVFARMVTLTNGKKDALKAN